ncbi:MAG: flagellar hook assembly protein FlgD [Acidobacteriota bacterium]|nr:flagellar hook assembly protein FlgD [Acidobacteriota bacterium]
MEINGLEPLTGITGSNPVESGEITEETFLQLLSTQLQHQDPLEPASDVEFIQQMATFASLEQQRITNANLRVMQLYESSINNSNALNIVGKEVKIQDSQIDHTGSGSHTFFYASDSEAQGVRIQVKDADGKVVYNTLQTGATDGEQSFTWHGVDDEGNPVEAGTYTVKVTLEGEGDTSFPTDVFQKRRVDGISYQNGAIMVLVDGRKMPIENVIEVYEPTEEDGAPGEFLTGSGQGKTRPGFQALPGFGEQQAHFYQQPRPFFQVIPGGR